ncbi:MAG: hypothetical protein IT545_16640, partial [Rhodobacteraceae bacterium]|nr:hypothetical protein [Paracoccaceae bacterium]
MGGRILLDPLLPWALLAPAAALAAALVALALWRGLAGWWLRALALAAILAAIANPSVHREERDPLPDIVLVVADASASQGLADRPGQTAAALAGIATRLAAIPGTEMRLVRVGDGPDNGGTRAMTALAGALAEVPRGQVAGAIVVTDGQVHDAALAPPLEAPLHVLLTGREGDWDRRLVVRAAPAFAILGEPVTLTLRIEDEGRVPAGVAGRADLAIAVGGEPPVAFSVPTGEDLELPVTLEHGGLNVLRFEVAAAAGEITPRNNAAIVQINGVRDRLRVLLVSGEPHAGERVWRNLLKADAAVDLVHFTILRPPEKQDGVPVAELSLIAFPTRELFIDKIDEFDLIIFDRYRLRGILPASYFDNIRRYVLEGGAVLVAAGPEYGSAESLFRTALADVLPGVPTARVLEEGFRPAVTALGLRHPVTEGL